MSAYSSSPSAMRNINTDLPGDRENAEPCNSVKQSWPSVVWEVVKHPFDSGLADLAVGVFFLKTGISTGDRAVTGLSTGLLGFSAYKLRRFTYMKRHEGPYPFYYGFG